MSEKLLRMRFIKTSPFRFVLLLVVLLLIWFGRSVQKVSNPSWEQPTMGTLCHITISGSIPKNELAALREKIDAELETVNQRMSTWQSDTEISQFNHFQSLEPFSVSPEFLTVVRRALKIAEITDGAFDPTVKPLVDHWGFGSRQMSNIEYEISNDEVACIMEFIGWKKVRLSNDTLIKLHPKLQLDLSAIAKGYGVDAVAEVIHSSGRNDFLVEIGGEIVVSGLNRERNPWRVGVESPNAANGDGVFQTLELLDGAMATSGDYRNFRIREDGSRFSHIIDPITGHPAETDVASVSVLANSCMDADAVATALFVMGSEKSFQWLDLRYSESAFGIPQKKRPERERPNHPEFEAFFILHSTNGTFTTRTTDGFPLEP